LLPQGRVCGCIEGGPVGRTPLTGTLRYPFTLLLLPREGFAPSCSSTGAAPPLSSGKGLCQKGGGKAPPPSKGPIPQGACTTFTHRAGLPLLPGEGG